jgi:hypothetical protein
MYPQSSPGLSVAMSFVALLVAMVAAASQALVGVRLGEEPLAIRKRLVAGIVLTDLWLLGTAALALTGVLARFEARPPPLGLLGVVAVGGAVALGFSPVGTRLSKLPLVALVAFQAFRLPLELVMHSAASAGVMPVQMSYSGSNYDILTGLTALLLTPLLWRGVVPRFVIFAWNALGVGLLLNIISIAVRSMPFIAAYGIDPAHLNTWVAYFPFVWLPAILVPAAVLGHVVLTRKLLAERA